MEAKKISSAGASHNQTTQGHSPNVGAHANNSYWSWEVFFMGGLSCLVCLATWAFMDKSTSLMTISQLAFGLAFIVNHPHFLSSYLLLYKDFRSSILKKKRYFWAAIIVPIVLGAALITAMAQGSPEIMGHIVTAMYFLVGWHYVKQIFGCVIVTSAQRKIFYKPWERRLLLTNLFATWFMSWLGSHVSMSSYDFYGITHHSLGLPPWTLQLTYWVVGLSLLANVWMHINKYIRDGVHPAPPAVAAFVALYAWYLPTFSHPGFGYLIPFFHSMQYLVFVWVLKKNQIQHEISPLKDRAWRSAWIKKSGGFALSSFILGALFFEYIPRTLDAEGLVATGNLGYAPFMAAFLLFINIHHYFIDNVIWRSDNETVKKFLFQTNSQTNSQKSSQTPPEQTSKSDKSRLRAI